MNVKEILHRHPPEILYHYTTQQGLLGIIGQREIWATRTQYMNDDREFRHGVQVVREELSVMKIEPQYHDKTKLFEEMEEGIEGIESFNVCVCSFSEGGDALSQWRAYGGGASGFSIGFSGAFMRAVSDHLNFWLVRVIYDEDEQRAMIRALLQDVLTENVENNVKLLDQNNREPEQPPGGNLAAT